MDWGSATVPRTGSAPASGGRRDGRVSARREIAHLAPTWATIAPMVTKAIQKWEAVNENRHGYHWAMLATPENTMKIPPPTSGNRPIRSTTLLARLTAGRATNRGHTTHSLATSTGTEAMPATTWMPWLRRYRPAGRAGIGSHAWGCCCRCEYSPVTKQMLNRIPSEAPR